MRLTDRGIPFRTYGSKAANAAASRHLRRFIAGVAVRVQSSRGDDHRYEVRTLIRTARQRLSAAGPRRLHDRPAGGERLEAQARRPAASARDAACPLVDWLARLLEDDRIGTPIEHPVGAVQRDGEGVPQPDAD